MRKISFNKLISKIALAVLIMLTTSCETLNQASQILAQSGIADPTVTEIGLGLKQALEIGTNLSSDRLSTKNGYLGNLAIKIAFPEEAQKVEKTLRSLGLNQLTDNVITSINHAAEDAAQQAKPIFIAAIKEMSIADASNILLSGQTDAATQYFKRVTSTQLRQKFSPVIKNSLTKVGATRYWGDVVNKYNLIPFVTKVNPDLEAFVTQKAIDGLFVEIAKEELKIRANVGARTGGLLQKVFAFADRKKVN